MQEQILEHFSARSLKSPFQIFKFVIGYERLCMLDLIPQDEHFNLEFMCA